MKNSRKKKEEANKRKKKKNQEAAKKKQKKKADKKKQKQSLKRMGEWPYDKNDVSLPHAGRNAANTFVG